MINDRIRVLRKKLGFTLKQFGKMVGVSEGAMSNIEKGNRNVTEQMVKSICREFNVNEEWLRTGKGDMTIDSDTFSLDKFLKQRGATELELQIIKSYFDLDPDMRKMLIDHFQKGISSPVTIDEKKEKTVEESEEEYKKNVLNSAQKEESTALNTTSAVEKII